MGAQACSAQQPNEARSALTRTARWSQTWLASTVRLQNAGVLTVVCMLRLTSLASGCLATCVRCSHQRKETAPEGNYLAPSCEPRSYLCCRRLQNWPSTNSVSQVAR